MANAPYSYLLEETLLASINAQSWASGVTLLGSMGGEITNFPAIRVSAPKGTEEPPNSGNYAFDVDVEVFGRIDPDNDGTYATAVTNHVTLAGNVQEWITGTLNTSTFSSSVSGFSNTLTAYNVRLESFDRDIDFIEGVFQDTFTIEVYLKEAA